ncbi:prospero homeobox protein 1 [Willisornis vidua]|uniref:Prospero homeobox protein 1 n=1 Tax=Willisornis vidua TaxID=1566151 RepID=A0ABQ9CVJ8_9PASS|nr:prospero homeobox protein 1 [Willisornis vidua]
MQEGLSPNHLKKAKLMFFYTRYPSSNMLKTYFSDVKFNRCITSQLIKWFSNFREFYYIQMEKYARQAINDGVTSTEELSITRDCELYRALNMHYNKANDFEASLVAEQTIVIINMLTLSDTTGECFSLLRMAVCIVQGIFSASDLMLGFATIAPVNMLKATLP